MSNLTGVIGSISGLSGSVASTSGLSGSLASTSGLSGTITTDSVYPIATGVNITGTMEDGEVATGNYTYFDADGDLEGVSTFRWLSDDDGAGTGKAAIGGATSQTYTIQVADVGKYLYFEVTPVALTGYSPGVAVESAPSVQVVASMDADALAIINAMTTPPNAARQALIDAWVVAGKAHGWWTKLEFLQIYAAHAEDSAKLNWLNPGTFDATPINIPTFTIDKGFSSALSSIYVRTGYTPSVNAINMTHENCGIAMGVATDIADGAKICGAYDGTQALQILPKHLGVMRGTTMNTSGTAASLASTNSIGHLGVFRNAGTQEFYKNKTQDQSTDIAGGALVTQEIYALARNTSGTPSNGLTGELRYILASQYLTQLEWGYFVDDMEAYLDAIGAGLIT